MNVSRQQAAGNDDANEASERGPRARTKRLMLETATRLMQAGVTPSVSEVAEAAEVSRATAYRYFPSQAALVHAVVDEGLGPILTWQSASKDPQRRVAELFDTAMPRIEAFEATFKAALVAFDTKNGVKRDRASSDADMQLDDYLATSQEKYAAKVKFDAPPKAAPAPAPVVPAAAPAPKKD